MLTIDELIAAAAECSVAVSRRQMKEWGLAGFLPEPTRAPLPKQGRGRAPYRYPAVALDAVLTLARWRSAMPSEPEQVRGWLWLAGCEGLDFEPDAYFRRWAEGQWARWQRENPALPAPAAVAAGLSWEQQEAILDSQPASDLPERFSGADSAALALLGVLPATMYADYDYAATRDRKLGADNPALFTAVRRLMTASDRYPALPDDLPITPEIYHRFLSGVSIPHALLQQPDWSFMRAIVRALLTFAECGPVLNGETGAWVMGAAFFAPLARYLLRTEPASAMLALHAVGGLFTPQKRAELTRALEMDTERLRREAVKGADTAVN